MARGSVMCGNFVSVHIPWAIFFCCLGCIVIGGSCLGVGANMNCRFYDHVNYGCSWRSDNLMITGVTFLSLAGLLTIVAIVLFCIIYCCPQTAQHPQHSYISSSQPAYVVGPQMGYQGPMVFSGGATNQQLYAIVPVKFQQQNGNQAYFNGFQLPPNIAPGIVPASGNPSATVPSHPISTTTDPQTVPHFK